jgi:hypothetical protein
LSSLCGVRPCSSRCRRRAPEEAPTQIIAKTQRTSEVIKCSLMAWIASAKLFGSPASRCVAAVCSSARTNSSKSKTPRLLSRTANVRYADTNANRKRSAGILLRFRHLSTCSSWCSRFSARWTFVPGRPSGQIPIQTTPYRAEPVTCLRGSTALKSTAN